MTEQWKDVIGYEKIYQISSFGRIKSLIRKRVKRNRILKPISDNAGYLCVCLCKNGKQKNHKIHRLVLASFNGPLLVTKQTHHLDNNKSNNRLDNLKQVTCRENIGAKREHGTMNYGSKNGRAILKDSDIYKIKKLLQSGRNSNLGKKYTQKEIAVRFNVNEWVIGDISTERSWKHINGDEE